MQEPISIAIVAASAPPYLAWLGRCAATPTVTPTVPAAPAAFDAIIVDDPNTLPAADAERLSSATRDGTPLLLLTPPAAGPLRALAGVGPDEAGPVCEVRVLFTDADDPLGRRLPDAFYVSGRFQPLQIEADGVTTRLYADWRYAHRPMVTVRPAGAGTVAVSALADRTHPTVQRLIYRLLRDMTGRRFTGTTLGVGILGYAPSVGRLHGTGAAATPDLAFRAACDLDPARLAAAQAVFPDLTVTESAAELAADPAVDIVIIATPPNTHAALAQQMIAAGKHVIVEKPLALTSADADAMIAAADAAGVLVACHQNRHWDIDFLAIQQAIADGLIGDPFYLETFIGGYGHPCGFWHSHDAVSGGTTFDWGAHYLDWVLTLLPGTIEGVIGTRQNRVWHDITNADQERIQLRLAGGREAEFTHSDLAFIPKPKWYLLGTEGTIVGHWRSVTSYEVDPVRYYDAHDIPPAELGATLTLRRRQGRDQIVEQALPLPARPEYPFHANLADHLLLGEPLTVPVAHSARIVAVLEAAARSADNGGRVEPVNI